MNVYFVNYLLFCLRCILIIIPCPGYIHPDEFFQSPELMAYEVLNLKSNITWEWKESSPIRNIVHPLASTGFVFWCIKMMNNKFGLHYSAEVLVILPRLFSLLFTCVMEKCLMKMLFWINRNHELVQFGLFLFRSSFLSLVFFTRNFSNGIEATLVALLLYIVLYCLIVKQPLSYTLLVYLGFLIAAGTFIRPTFLLFIFYPMLYLIVNLLWRRKLFPTILKLMCITIGLIIGTLSMLAFDHHYYSIKSGIPWPVTPLNFILYNTNIDQVRKHGLHPRYLHILVNMFILFGPLYLLLLQFIMGKCYFGIYSLLEGKQVYKHVKQVFFNIFSFSNSKKYKMGNVMLMSAIIPVFFLSVIPHQEARFLLPIFIPLILFTSSQLYSSGARSKWLFFWLLFNSLCVLWYGFLHQAGLYKSLAYMNTLLQERNDNHTNVLIYWHTYMVPQHLLGIAFDDNSIKIYDLGGRNYHAVEHIMNSCQSDETHVSRYVHFNKSFVGNSTSVYFVTIFD